MTPQDRISKIRFIHSTRKFGVVDGAHVDHLTANAILCALDGFKNDEARRKFSELTAPRMATLAFQRMK